jgi:aryl-alcohol dehydrogenase-like predicted oxidoreductase
MQKGLLSGKVTRAWVDALPATDHRRGDPQFNEPLLSKNIALNDALRGIAARLGTTPAELAIAWVLRQPRITSAIVGARKPGQFAETIGGGRLTIPADALAEIGKILG